MGGRDHAEVCADHRANNRRLLSEVTETMAALPDCCNAPGFTYLIHGADMVKIGKSKDPTTRALDLQIGSPVPLGVFAIARGDCESRLHAICSDHRSHGEWFDLAGVRRALVVHIKRAQVLGVCMSCSMRMGRDATTRALRILRAPEIEALLCTREPGAVCGPNGWFTADGNIAHGWHGEISCKRSLEMAMRLGRLSKQDVVKCLNDDRTPLPTDDLDKLRAWTPGCIRCAVLDGATQLTYSTARAILREPPLGEELRERALALVMGRGRAA